MLPSYFHEISLSPLLSVEAEAALSERMQALAVLKSRERSVVIRRFGLDGHQPMTLELIGRSHPIASFRPLRGVTVLRCALGIDLAGTLVGSTGGETSHLPFDRRA
jgi:hypothetical protein